MPITTLAVGAAVTPTVIKTYISHFTNRKPRRQKPTAHISYDEGLHLIRSFLNYASHHTVEDLQAFTAQRVPSPAWVRTENITIPAEHISKAAKTIIDQLGASGVQQVGGSQWWQWRPVGAPLKGEWVEMRALYNEQMRTGSKSRRIMMYVHGGGYFFGSVDVHRYQMQRHARKLEARVFAPRYRLAPQFPFPCGLQDCLAAYLYLLTLHDPTEIILAGDSAGGGMIVSILCILRDQGLTLPAGAILISPWVDLTHSFPSLLGSDELDYIPPYGFMQKPSVSWPPPNDEEIKIISNRAKDINVPITPAANRSSSEQRLSHASDEQDKIMDPNTTVPTNDDGDIRPSRQIPLSIELDGTRVILKDQIQMYATNQLLAHPLISPVLQPSLGGLPPILILVGGGEILRDEQIYLAHKMANPSQYPLGSAYRSTYDPSDGILKKYKPTPVQLQVWEDLCHVAPTLSFTRPAKFMYRSIAQFGAWVLAKAQRTAIEIMDDDNISIISSLSDSDFHNGGEAEFSSDGMAKPKLDSDKVTGSVGRAGDPLPRFENNMIRQRIDRFGRIYPLADPQDLPALQMHPDEVGVIKPGPVRNWLEARKIWDAKYARTAKKVEKKRIRALASGEIRGFEPGESPPPSALAGRRTDMDLLVKEKQKSYGLAMWSMWGSKHDKSTMKREEEAVEVEKAENKVHGNQHERDTEVNAERGDPTALRGAQDEARLPSPTSPTRFPPRDRSTSMKRRRSESKPRGRRRTITVTDTGQAEGDDLPPVPPEGVRESSDRDRPAPLAPMQSLERNTSQSPEKARASSPNPSLLSSGFLPKFIPASHLRDDSGAARAHAPVMSDAASTMTGNSRILADDASTRAVFAVAGVMKGVGVGGQEPGKAIGTSIATGRSRSFLTNDAVSLVSDGEDVDDGVSISPSAISGVLVASSIAGAVGAAGAHLGSDTPRSQRSLDRLRSHQQDEGMGRLDRLRSPSSTAVVRAEGVVGVVDGTGHDGEKEVRIEKEKNVNNAGEKQQERKETEVDDADMDGGKDLEPERPKIYERSDTKFQTAMENVSGG